MISRRLLTVVALFTTAVSFFLLGVFHARTDDAFAAARYDAKLDAIRAEMKSELVRARHAETHAMGTSGDGGVNPRSEIARQQLITQVKQELQAEMGLVSLRLVRERRSSFVELYSEDNFGKSNYGTAGYLGGGYFVTVKHAVMALGEDPAREGARKIVTIKVLYNGKEVSARLVDTGDANAEVHSGDWAIIRTRPLDLPALKPNTGFAFDFAEPIVRLGNDYSKGISVSTGYIGQRMANGLVTALTDGHPGVSGGGVLDRQGDLVGIPIGRMQGDYRFSFILPIRSEMFRKVPAAGS
ncbi:MAG: serine protease [Vicinamibacterales bacterium]